MDPAAPDGFDALLAGVGRAFTGVVHCFGLDSTPLDQASSASLEHAGVLTCGSVLHLTQALLRANSPARIWLVTRDAVSAISDDKVAGATQAPLWGFGRVIALEHPELWGGLIDVSAQSSSAVTASAIADHLVAQPTEDQVALRNSGRFVPRLVAGGSVAANPVPVHKDASYLITGGTGGVGLLVARELARQGAGHLVLLSRSGLPDRALWPQLPQGEEAYQQVSTVRAIEALGTSVTYWPLCYGPRRVERCPDGSPPCAVARRVHAASYIAAARLRDLTLTEVTRMLGPKVTGTWVLEQITSACNLDFFVGFSSTAGVFGATDLAHYAAANVFIDAYAESQRAAGRNAVSISWGTWEKIRGSDEQQRLIDRGGLKIMPAARTSMRLRTCEVPTLRTWCSPRSIGAR